MRRNANICSNGGKCAAEGGNFYCICPVTHYGKTCEHLADQTNCERHLCQNNSTCVSTKSRRTIVNTVLLNQLRVEKGAQKALDDRELALIDLEVNYECICQKGTFGALCDESEADRTCRDVYCLGRGKGKSDNSGKCLCECEKQFFGERCEQLSACFDTLCENGGICQDVVDAQAKTIRAVCKCPEKVEIIGATVTGENCETLHIPTGIAKELLPCEQGRDSFTFFKKLKAKIDLSLMAEIDELEAIQMDYHDGNSSNAKMSVGWCQNAGKCVAEVVRVKSGRAYFVHRCECTDALSDGYYCEYRRSDACSLRREEVARGARWDEKCTDMQHGACVDIMGEPKCVCKPDYTGESCEVFDPCARHPCKHGDCIPTPSSADSSFGTQRFQCLCPLSAKLDANNSDCVPIIDKKCGAGVCGNGRCVPCDSDISAADDDLMPLCNLNENAQGFRCLCEAGYLPPVCKVHTNPCHQNLCQNSATCRVNEAQKSYDCICLNGTRGTLCETIVDSCDAFGNNVCEHGVCVNDEYFHRGFSCDCDDNFEGLNCDVALSSVETLFRRVQKHYEYSLPLSVCVVTLLLLFLIILAGNRGRGGQKLAENP
ncbi:unnamed protein product [Caenorhabditis sp. 36 PRJEB53466]|nr:unnamed protein product [Caenorhabditis sp. 36 PRJEB53466]